MQLCKKEVLIDWPNLGFSVFKIITYYSIVVKMENSELAFTILLIFSQEKSTNIYSATKQKVHSTLAHLS